MRDPIFSTLDLRPRDPKP